MQIAQPIVCSFLQPFFRSPLAAQFLSQRATQLCAFRRRIAIDAPMPPRRVNADDPEQLLGDSGMVDRKNERALNSVLVEDDINPFEALNLPTLTIAQETEMSKRTIETALKSMMMLFHPDRLKSPNEGELEIAIIKMRNAQSAREALNAAIQFKSQGWFGVFILKYCGGREPQEYAARARINIQRVDEAKARIAAKLQEAQRRADAAANRAERESNLAAQREREERERAEARSETAGLDAARAEELARLANLRQAEADSRYDTQQSSCTKPIER